MSIGGTIRKIYESRPNILKTIWVNFKVLDFYDAIKFPIILYGRVELRGLKRGSIVFDNIMTATLRIGGGGGFYGRVPQFHTLYHNYGTHLVHGRCNILNGGIVNVTDGAVLETGKRVSIGANVRIKCSDRIFIGDSCMVSWDVQIFDTDFHYVLVDGNKIMRNNKPVIIGNAVWIGSRVSILKGTELPDGTIVSSNSLVNKSFVEGGGNLVLGGVPAKKIGSGKRRLMYNGDDMPSLIAVDTQLNQLFSKDKNLEQINISDVLSMSADREDLGAL